MATGMAQEAVAVLAYRRFLSERFPNVLASAVLVAAHNLVTSSIQGVYLPPGHDQRYCVTYVLQLLPSRYYPDVSNVTWSPPCQASMVPGLGPVGVTGGPNCPDTLPTGCR